MKIFKRTRGSISPIQVIIYLGLIFLSILVLLTSNVEYIHLSVSKTTQSWDPWWWWILNIGGGVLVAMAGILITQHLLHKNASIREEKSRKLEAVSKMGEAVQGAFNPNMSAFKETIGILNYADTLDNLANTLSITCHFHDIPDSGAHRKIFAAKMKLINAIGFEIGYSHATNVSTINDETTNKVRGIVQNEVFEALNYSHQFLKKEYIKIKAGEYDDK